MAVPAEEATPVRNVRFREGIAGRLTEDQVREDLLTVEEALAATHHRVDGHAPTQTGSGRSVGAVAATKVDVTAHVNLCTPNRFLRFAPEF